MRQAMKNVFQCIHHSVLRREDRILEQPYIIPACCLALAGQQQCRQGRRGAALELLGRAQPEHPLAAAGSQLVLVSAWCKECVTHCRAGARRVSALCLTHSDRDLPARLFLPRSSFSCSLTAQHGKWKPLKSRVGCSVRCDLGGENQEWLCFCCADWGCSQRPVNANTFPEAMAVTDQRRQKALGASGLFWEAC